MEIWVEGASMTGQVSLMKVSTKEQAELVYTSTLSLIGKHVAIITFRYASVNLYKGYYYTAKIRNR